MSIEKCTVSLTSNASARSADFGLRAEIAGALYRCGGTASIRALEAGMDGRASRASLLRELLRMEDAGLLRIEYYCYSGLIRELYKRIENPAEICSENPGLWNVVGFENLLKGGWLGSPASAEYKEHFSLKDLEKDAYLSLIEPFLAEVSPRSRALDAGCGMGRFSTFLASKGFVVSLLDACRSCLMASVRCVLDTGYENLDAYWADVASLDMFEDGIFDLVLAIETICYCTAPSDAMSEIRRVTKKGGTIVISVEAPIGAIGSDPSIGIDGARQILRGGTLTIPQQAHTRYFTRRELHHLLEDAGLRILLLEGTHYFLEGVFMRQIENSLTNIESLRPQLMELEEKCRTTENLSEAARAWLAVARVE